MSENDENNRSGECSSPRTSPGDLGEMMEEMAASKQKMLGSLLSSSCFTPEDEIERRVSLFHELWAMFRVSETPTYLFGAIDQAEVVLRRLPSTSPDLPVYLDELSSMRVSEFEITRSAATLDQAVELGLRARNEAVAIGLPDSNKDLYLKILPVALRRSPCPSNQNEKATEGGPQVTVEKAMELVEYLEKVSRAPRDNRIREAACEKLPGYFRTACKTNGTPNASITLWNQQKCMIMVYADAIEAGEDLGEEDLESRVRETEAKRKGTEDVAKQRKAWTLPEYTTEFGLRDLATDPASGKILMDSRALMEKVYGYTDTTPLPVDRFIEREVRLELETREAEVKEGKHPNPDLCRICRKLRVLVPRSGGGWKWNAEISFLPYGNYNQIYMRSSCAVCSLLLDLISTKEGLHPRLAVIDPQVQGLGVEGDQLDGEEILRVSYGSKEVGTLSIVEPSIPIRHQELPLRQLKRALVECDAAHGRQCNRPALMGHLSSPINMLQIDVIDECLVQTTSAVKYFALSYVWGKVAMSETLKANLASRLTKGGLARSEPPNNPLPQTVSDAIALVRSLGERFLWVDALCIVQDDDLNKEQNIHQMDKVYSRAFATIIVLSGLDATSGLPGVRPGTRGSLIGDTISVSERSANLELDPSSSQLERIQIVANPPPLSLTLDSSTWNSRGWTFQERLLSVRCIYMADRAVYFQCRKDLRQCETGRADSATAPGLNVLDNPLYGLRRLEERLVDNQSGRIGDAPLRVVFSTYKGLVEGYTARQLTFPRDVLNAFAGVLSVIGRHVPNGDACGLPGAFFDLALLWIPVRKLKRREEVVVRGDATATDGNGKCPEWSWAGFVGPVEYRLFGKEEEKRPLPATLVVGGFRILSNGKMLTVAARRVVGVEDDGTQPVVKVEDAPATDLDNTTTDYGPNILQFDAPIVPVTAFPRGSSREYLCVLGEVHSTGEQSVYRLYDQDKKHCGLFYESMVPIVGFDESIAPSLVGIVQHGETGVPYKGPNRVEGDIPLFDQSVYEAAGPESGVVDALVVAWGKDGIGRRASVARIHAKAWERAKPEVRHVSLG